ncbi:ABC transporter substrate-binding protein [Asaccharospora irregularis]|uniref:ABC-type transport system, substrate-binding protein n=1 Tax=Asaccharospora irregularis DSM 2635 TaxID=1121321 RepID=A0A1M5P870_9FIRM|nr:ABC transporter substrate-binding protein [Asaccharospora irregularis]SHG97996.1 ABC-type transport system, substrate-binding protein [Asaccharospora irregularis DSM 2635]
MKRIKVLSIILTIAIMVVGCNPNGGKDTSNKESKSAINSEYINLTMVKPKTINPITNKDKSVSYITNLIYDGLFTIDENYNVVPQLVDQYTLLQGGRGIRIKLKDAKWHDEGKVTSDDVRFTVDFIKKTGDSPYNKLVENIASVDTTSSDELTINFKNAYAFSIEKLIFPIVSQDKIGKSDKKDIDNNNNNLIGNGPYKVEKYQEREGITLVANKEYYDELPEDIRNIKVSIVPDYDAQISMVMSLDSDMTNISLGDLSKFQEKEFNITNYEGRDFEYIMLNYNNKFFNNLDFRKAIAHAINRENIIQEGYMGDATLVNFPLNSKSKYYNKDIKSLAYDKEKAISYLEKVDLADNVKIQNENTKTKNTKNIKNTKNTENTKNKDQNNKKSLKKNDPNLKREADSKLQTKKEIKDLNLKIIVNKDNGERVKTANIISDNLKAIGIKSTIEQLTPEEIQSALAGNDYDLALLGWELSITPDPVEIIQSSGYSDEKLNNYISSLLNSTSQEQTKSVYKALQKHVVDNVAFISLGIRDEYIVNNRRIEGELSPNSFDVYEGISNISIKEYNTN